MISHIRLKNFKCFEELDLELSNLSLLAGMNSAGKSTVFQSILLLAQSESDALVLNGSYTELGALRDVLTEWSETDTVSITLDNFECSIGAQHLEATETSWTTYERHPSLDTLTYVNCERVGPRSFFPMPSRRTGSRELVDKAGLHAVHILNSRSETKVLQAAQHPDGKGESLRSQVEAWMSEISPGAKLSTRVHSDMDIAQLGVSFPAPDGRTRDFRSINVGFGVTYALPVLVSALSSSPGDILLLENPEAHLHPRGQRKLAEMLVGVALAGVQVFVETHSDHFLNGVRLAVAKRVILPKDITLYFFSSGPHGSIVTQPRMLPDGGIDPWPSGFFDEWEVALDELIGTSQE
ncbi:MAG: DUF3696 domain-containing protein [Myxococcota bacterium]